MSLSLSSVMLSPSLIYPLRLRYSYAILNNTTGHLCCQIWTFSRNANRWFIVLDPCFPIENSTTLTLVFIAQDIKFILTTKITQIQIYVDNVAGCGSYNRIQYTHIYSQTEPR